MKIESFLWFYVPNFDLVVEGTLFLHREYLGLPNHLTESQIAIRRRTKLENPNSTGKPTYRSLRINKYDLSTNSKIKRNSNQITSERKKHICDLISE